MATEQPAWPPTSCSEEGTWTVDEVQVGDLVFSSKEPNADWVQHLNQIAGEQWRHVGAVVDHGGELHVVEIDKNTFGIRPLTTFVDAYEHCGAARLGLDRSCIDAATNLMFDQIDNEHVYAWDDMVLAGILCLTKRGIFTKHPDRVRAALAAASAVAKEAQQEKLVDSYTCSGFVQWAYEEAEGPCSIEHNRWRSGRSWPPRLTTLDELFEEHASPLRTTYAEATLLELLDVVDATELSGDWRPTLDQIGEAVRVLGAAVCGFGVADPPARLQTDGRWVTPTDLWESRSVAKRGRLLATPSE